jgi:3-oxoacyl-[acyl-carrier protein] reductase|tara:strand:+ start:3677 stop:4432 length:756 start_codon:yes stop_codon:yes gene_type:complete
MPERVAIVTGGSGDIGRAIAVSLARQGTAVMINYFKDQAGAEKGVASIVEKGGRARSFKADVTQYEAFEALIKATRDQLGEPHILVNNAGWNALVHIDQLSPEQWDMTVNLNLKSVFLGCKLVYPMMKKQKFGRIINMSSISGMRGGLSCDVDYSACKAGIVGLTKALARDAGAYGITVNAVAPGIIWTQHLAEIWSRLDKQKKEGIMRDTPIGRLGTPEEVAAAVTFLASEDAGYITGTAINVNGGAYMA